MHQKKKNLEFVFAFDSNRKLTVAYVFNFSNHSISIIVLFFLLSNAVVFCYNEKIELPLKILKMLKLKSI